MTEAAAGPAEESGGPPAATTASELPSEVALARWTLAAFGAIWVIARLVLFSLDRAPGWDESIYLSQVTPGVKAIFFIPARARGTPLLIAPITLLGGSIVAVRLYLTLVSTLVAAAVFWSWAGLVGWAAPLAAFGFAFFWEGLLESTEVYPHFWAAILALGVAVAVVRSLEGGRRRDVAWAAALTALMALFRPTEALIAAFAIGLSVLLFWRSQWRTLVPLMGGLVLGWLPWGIENSVRYGGLANALKAGRASAPLAINSIPQTLAQNLGFTEGGVRLSSLRLVPLSGEIWWGALIVLTLVGMFLGTTSTDRKIARLGCIGMVALAFEYIAFVSPQTSRYLLPAYAFGSLAASIGLVTLFRRGGPARVVAVSILAVSLPWAIWQGSVANRIEHRKTIQNGLYRTVGLAVHQLAGGADCAVWSRWNQPEIELASGCRAVRFSGRVPTNELITAASGGTEVFVVLTKTPPPDWAFAGVAPVRTTLPSGETAAWIYRVPAT